MARCRYLFGASNSECIGRECSQWFEGECVDITIAKYLKKIAFGDKKIIKAIKDEDKKEENKENKE